MKDITNILSQEHQLILKAIEAILSECHQINAGKLFEAGFFERAIFFIKNYADKFHHAKEEDVLFIAMCKNQENMHCNPIPQMLNEHESGRNFVEGMETGLKTLNKDQVIENAIGYCHLLQNHIYKEDNVLYPMAERALNDLQKEEVLKNYIEVEKNALPAGVLEVCLDFVIKAGVVSYQ